MDGKVVVIDYEKVMNDYVPSPQHDPGDAHFESSFNFNFNFNFNFKSKAATESKFYEPLVRSQYIFCRPPP